MRLGTAGGGMDIGVFRVEVQVEDTVLSAKIGFSNNYEVSFNILGRESFFNRFSICFNEIMKTVILVPLGRMCR